MKLLGSSPKTSAVGLAAMIATWAVGIVRLVSTLSRGEDPTDAVIEAGVLGLIGLILFLSGRMARDNDVSSEKAGAKEQP